MSEGESRRFIGKLNLMQSMRYTHTINIIIIGCMDNIISVGVMVHYDLFPLHCSPLAVDILPTLEADFMEVEEVEEAARDIIK
jgi:hypothetical protein